VIVERPLVRTAWSYAIALGAVVVTSVLIGAILALISIGNLSTLYLIPVLLVATRLGRTPAIVAALASFLIFDWFFVQPTHELRIADPAEWVSLVVFLITAVVTGELAASERARAQIAVRREREAVLLYDALRLMADPDLDSALRAVAERVRAEMRVSGAEIDLRIAGQAYAASAGAVGTSSAVTEILGGGRAPTELESGQPGRWIRVVRPQVARDGGPATQRAAHRFEVPVRGGGRTIGHISLLAGAPGETFSEHQRRLLELMATQLGSLAGHAELREATTRAEVLRRTDDLKTALLNAVSHDLRTPLASIIASTGSLRQRDVRWTQDERDEFIEAIEQQAQRLSRIVGNLLDLSRIEAGALRPEKQLHDVATLIDDVVDRVQEMTRQHQIVVAVDQDLPPVPLDEVQIDQVLSNLLENAAKYAPPGTAIVVSARPEGDELQIEVADRGPGLPPNELDSIFAPFHRVDEGRGAFGLGLGLAVAKGLVEAHGGHIYAANRPDGGARFVFTLPLSRVETAAEAVAR
jgi:two-component system sensor histidine kinase KdpD